MKSLFTVAALGLLVSFGAQANDGGAAGIKVSEIKMREMSDKEPGQVLRSIKKPNFKVLIKGGEAKKLQKILPSNASVLTSMQPELKNEFNETFKTLGIYSDNSRSASSKLVVISCNDGDLVYNESTGKSKIVKKSDSECSIEIVGMDNADAASEQLGDVQTFEPKTCK